MKKHLSRLGLVLLGTLGALVAVKLWPGLMGINRAVSVQSVASAKTAKMQVWACSMHPQIRLDHFDVCPLCGMDLTAVNPDGESTPPEELKLSDRARMMANVATEELVSRELVKELRTVCRVALDETRVAHIAAWIDGRVDQVFADFPGTIVRKGEHLVRIYSPELYSTQKEFLATVQREQQTISAGRSNGGLVLSKSARERMLLWGITPEQIDELARSGKAETHLTIFAPMGGTIIEKNIRAGQYVKQGDSLYTIADLSHVWLVLEIYESELAWVRLGQPVQVMLESEPHQPRQGKVAFIEPVLNQQTRTVQVRVILENPEGKFRPGMYAQALIRVPIMPDGTSAPTGLEGQYICPMHPYVVADKPDTCDVCQMPLEKVPGEPARSPAELHPQVLSVPAEAVLTTGLRQLVYIEREPGRFRLVEPKLGPRAGDYYPVLSGLKAGDRVVVRGNFLLDSQYQVTGKPSLLYPHGSMGDVELHVSEDPTQPGPKEAADLAQLPPEDRKAAEAQKICPISGELLGSMGVPVKMQLQGRTVFLCCQGCEESANKDPAGTLKKLDEASRAIPSQPHQ
jgi:Cu(I)/Ag(I) efflux system membrane fusion protein